LGNKLIDIRNPLAAFIEGSGLVVSVNSAQILASNTLVLSPFTLIGLSPNVTSFIFFDLTGLVLNLNTSGFPASTLPIAIAVTSNSGVVGLVDKRPDFLASAVGSFPSFSDAEVPSGAINGSNKVFTLMNPPGPPSSLELFVNGVLQTQGALNDYILNGAIITFNFAPQIGDGVVGFYRH
jgi:hypothetical protein